MTDYNREVWDFILEAERSGKSVALMVVADSNGSSPGRAGFKMAITKDSLCGSVGGGVLETRLVDGARDILASGGKLPVPVLTEHVHRKDVAYASGMICSGRQTVLTIYPTATDIRAIEMFVRARSEGDNGALVFGEKGVSFAKNTSNESQPETVWHTEFSKRGDRLLIVGGGHCSLALSELASRCGFSVTVFDDRPDLNTIKKNEFAEIRIVDDYMQIGKAISDEERTYVVVMTIGYEPDKVVLSELAGKKFAYLAALGSSAKIAAMFRDMRDNGVDAGWLETISAPAGLDIGSKTPMEIAVAIVAEMISHREA
ncbi:MAG: XdhC family protein [Pyrinomonadaceae bacterium]